MLNMDRTDSDSQPLGVVIIAEGVKSEDERKERVEQKEEVRRKYEPHHAGNCDAARSFTAGLNRQGCRMCSNLKPLQACGRKPVAQPASWEPRLHGRNASSVDFNGVSVLDSETARPE